MLRVLLTPRWIGLTLLALAVILAFVLLGVWQWQRTQDVLAAERAALAAPVAVSEVAVPGQDLDATSLGREVTVTGTYEADRQLLVVNRELDGKVGVWVLTPIRLPDGTLVPVVRGWLPSGTAPGSAPPSGTVTVSGVLQPDEQFYAAAKSPGPGLLVTVTGEAIAAAWGDRVAPGFVVLESQAPPSAPAPLPVRPAVRAGDVPFPLQNFFYAFQWWFFALFAVAMWGRWLWLDVQDRRAADRVDQAAAAARPAAG